MRVAPIVPCPPRRAVSRDARLSARGRARENRRQDPMPEVMKPLLLSEQMLCEAGVSVDRFAQLGERHVLVVGVGDVNGAGTKE